MALAAILAENGRPLVVVVVLVAAVLVVLALGGWWLARTQDADTRSMIARVGRLPWRGKARLAWALLRDRRVPIWLRGLVPAVIVYLATPIDIIPDFVPVLGHLDDIVVLLVAGGLLARFVPRPVLEDHIARLEQEAAPGASRADRRA